MYSLRNSQVHSQLCLSPLLRRDINNYPLRTSEPRTAFKDIAQIQLILGLPNEYACCNYKSSFLIGWCGSVHSFNQHHRWCLNDTQTSSHPKQEPIGQHPSQHQTTIQPFRPRNTRSEGFQRQERLLQHHRYPFL